MATFFLTFDTMQAKLFSSLFGIRQREKNKSEDPRFGQSTDLLLTGAVIPGNVSAGKARGFE